MIPIPLISSLAVFFCDLYSMRPRGDIFTFWSIEIPQHKHSFIIQILITWTLSTMADLFIGNIQQYVAKHLECFGRLVELLHTGDESLLGM